MNHRLLGTLALIVCVLVGLAAKSAGAATTAAGPYYANPSWDQQLPASTRFVVLSNWIDAAHPSGGAAVLDRETGLVWEQSPTAPPTTPNAFIWEGAQLHCIDLNAGGRTGWRLPTVQELMSLVDRSVPFPGPTLPSGHPFSNVQSFVYWSATTYAADASVAWGVFFGNGHVALDDKGNTLFAWCVRGGQGVDPQ
jgi:hypothetical protein